MDIRQATVLDLDRVAPLFDAYRQFYGRPSDIHGARGFLAARLEQQQSVILLAEEGAEPLGFTQLFPSFTSTGMAQIFILNDLFVAPQARGRAVGKALLDAAESHCRAQGAVRLALSTAVDNLAAQALYEGAGWERDSQFLSYEKSLV